MDLYRNLEYHVRRPHVLKSVKIHFNYANYFDLHKIWSHFVALCKT